LALGYPVILVSDGHSTVDNKVLSAAQISAHHNETLASIESFGPRVRAVPASEVRVEAWPRVQPDPPVRAFYLASAGGGGPVNLVLLGVTRNYQRLRESSPF